MTRFEKLYKQIVVNGDDKISFADLQFFMDKLGFSKRVKGDHFIYTLEGIHELVNLQPRGKEAKEYQVKQVRNIVLRYKLGGEPYEA